MQVLKEILELKVHLVHKVLKDLKVLKVPILVQDQQELTER